MCELSIISAKNLCFILSAESRKLTPMQTAFRSALENINSPEKLDAMRQKACLTDVYPISLTDQEFLRM
jgi:hypothetical protein